MRLTDDEMAAIKTAARDVFGVGAVVRLFGSRIHDHLRGGDIDLHVEVSDAEAAYAARPSFVCRLHRQIGERSIDILIQQRNRPPGKLDIEAKRTGVVL